MDLLTDSEHDFIQKNLTNDPIALLLGPPADSVRMNVVAAQLAARQKANSKLPSWYAHPTVIFPATLSVEQASSELTAAYKASLVEGQLLIDITGGMGVDSLAFARRMKRVVYVEQQPTLAELATHNFPLLGGTNIDVQTGDGITFLQTVSEPIDWIYVDPARRKAGGGRAVRLDEYEPRLPDWYRTDRPTAVQLKAKRILLKASPFIDIDASIHFLDTCEAVHIVSVENECKEVLFILHPTTQSAPIPLTAINLHTDGTIDRFVFYRREEATAVVAFQEPLRYLYEPNASILKAGAFRSVAARYNLFKIAPNSHLYTHDQYWPSFPGRVFETIGVCKPDRQRLQKFIPDRRASLAVRNFPEPIDTLRKKLGLRDGGSTYIFATTFFDNKKRLILTQKPMGEVKRKNRY